LLTELVYLCEDCFPTEDAILRSLEEAQEHARENYHTVYSYTREMKIEYWYIED
jgi:hypothetical protein